MLGRHGKVQMNHSVGTRCVECTLGHMLLQRSAGRCSVTVKLEQTFGQCSVIEPLGLQQVGYYSLVVAVRNKLLDRLALIVLAGGIQVLVECKFGYAVKESLLKRGSGYIIRCVQKSKKIFEHSAGCA